MGERSALFLTQGSLLICDLQQRTAGGVTSSARSMWSWKPSSASTTLPSPGVSSGQAARPGGDVKSIGGSSPLPRTRRAPCAVKT